MKSSAIVGIILGYIFVSCMNNSRINEKLVKIYKQYTGTLFHGKISTKNDKKTS